MPLHALFVERTESIVFLVFSEDHRKTGSQIEKNKAFATFERVSLWNNVISIGG